MATLLNAGLPLLRSLEVMIRQQKGPFKEVLEDLAENVRGGNSFSDGLEMHPKLFDNLFINMVRAGEAGGVLEVVLDRLATFMEKAENPKEGSISNGLSRSGCFCGGISCWSPYGICRTPVRSNLSGNGFRRWKCLHAWSYTASDKR